MPESRKTEKKRKKKQKKEDDEEEEKQQQQHTQQNNFIEIFFKVSIIKIKYFLEKDFHSLMLN